jgi:hypothetical protein
MFSLLSVSIGLPNRLPFSTSVSTQSVELYHGFATLRGS